MADTCWRMAECIHDKNGCGIDHDVADTYRLLAARKEPATHREDANDPARAGHDKTLTRRAPGSREVDRGGPHLSATLRVAAPSAGANVVSRTRTTQQARRRRGTDTEPAHALSPLPGSDRHDTRKQTRAVSAG